ncbi:MAG: hypothetical protein Q9226_003549 [Calogaya cf. arnoldii]
MDNNQEGGNTALPMAFEHTELPVSDHGCIRLLILDDPFRDSNVINCWLETYTLTECPEYYALSYTWGNPFGSNTLDEAYSGTYSIYIDSKSYMVRKNLHDALLQLRRSHADSYLWVDAICIWQANLQERNSQVAMMDQIYEKAAKVLIWLGVGDADTASVVQLIARIASLPLTVDHVLSDGFFGLPAHDSPVWYSLVDFFRKSYFQRIWVLQENAFAKDALVYCGAVSFPARQLWDASRLLRTTNLCSDLMAMNQDSGDAALDLVQTGMGAFTIYSLNQLCRAASGNESFDGFCGIVSDSNENEIQANACRVAPGDKSFEGFCGIVSDTNDKLIHANAATVIRVLVAITQSFAATDPRDRIFALLNIVKRVVEMRGLDPLPVSADYTKTPQEVCIHLMTLILERNAWLGYLAFVPGKTTHGLPNLPSWVKDLTTRSTQPFMWIQSTQHTPRFNAGKVFHSKGQDFKINGSRLHLVTWQIPLFNAVTVFPYSWQDFQINGNRLHLKAWQLDTISDLGDTESDITECGEFEDVAKVILRCPAIYKTSQDRVEVLWRTLLSDQTVHNYPAPARLAQSFSAFLKYRLFTGIERVGENDQDLASYLRARPNLDILAQADHTRIFAGFRRVREELAECVGPADDAGTAVSMYVKRLAGEMQFFSDAFSRVAAGRRLFRTKSGWLGLGSQYLQVGDSVWIFAAARTPYALRKVADEAAGVYELAGEVYVHGAMHGEPLGDGEPEWENIVLH